jgi:hypothetical protein
MVIQSKYEQRLSIVAAQLLNLPPELLVLIADQQGFA